MRNYFPVYHVKFLPVGKIKLYAAFIRTHSWGLTVDLTVSRIMSTFRIAVGPLSFSVGYEPNYKLLAPKNLFAEPGRVIAVNVDTGLPEGKNDASGKA